MIIEKNIVMMFSILTTLFLKDETYLMRENQKTKNQRIAKNTALLYFRMIFYTINIFIHNKGYFKGFRS